MKIVWCSLLALSLLLPGTGAFAGASGGTRTAAYNLDPGKSQSWNIAFEASQLAEISITEGSSPHVTLSIAVFDSAGKHVCGGATDGSFLNVYWTPASQQIYTIRAENMDKTTSVAVTLITN